MGRGHLRAGVLDTRPLGDEVLHSCHQGRDVGDRARDDYNAWQTFEPAGYDFLAKNFPDAAGADARA